MNNNKKLILLVEDDFLVAMLEKKELEGKGYEVIHAATGEKAISIIAKDDSGIDLVLMDIDLGPGIDGTQAAQKILECRYIPIVFLSSHTDPEIVERTEKITSYGYVVKNSGIIVLDASIKMAFKLFNANRSLKESEKRYRTLIESMPDTVMCFDNKARHIFVSKNVKQITGIDSNDFIGKTHRELGFPDDLCTFWEKAIKSVFTNGKSIEKEFEFNAPTGRVIFDWRLIAEYSFSDEVSHVLSIARDITAKKRTETILKRQVSNNKLLSEISLMALENKSIDDFLSLTVSRLGRSIGVCRAYIFHYDEKSNTMDNTHEFCQEGVMPEIQDLQNLPVSLYRWWHDTLRSGSIISFDDIDKIPDENARKTLKNQGICSILVVPLFVNSRYYGFIGFDDCKNHRIWSRDYIDFLQSLSHIIGTVIEKDFWMKKCMDPQ